MPLCQWPCRSIGSRLKHPPHSFDARFAGSKVYSSLSVADLNTVSTHPLPLPDASVDAIVCAGVLHYIRDFDALFAEWLRVARVGAIILFTHRCELWGRGKECDASQKSADELEAAGRWKQVHQSAPQQYLSLHPDQRESSKQVFYLAFRVL